MSNAVSLEELRDFKFNYCDNFFPKNLSTWSTIVLLECAKDYDLMDEIKQYISIRNDTVSAKELDTIMQELRNKTNLYIKSANNLEKGEDYYRTFTRGLVYYGILESLDELASFSTDLIEAIKNKYGYIYL